ncbi:MAG TPA: chemotaxis protein CheW [Methanospirillum sp.]|nr:chemotaxis protein CheW [Methanospirillum sp.]
MEELLTLVEIRLGNDHYLIDSDIVDKFILPLESEIVYDAPPYIEGMASWADEMIPAINVAPLLGMERSSESHRKRTMIIPAGAVIDTAMAVSVDDVFMVRKIRPADIMPVDISACQGIEDYVKGIVRLREENSETGNQEQLVLLYLNLQKMLKELLKGRVARPVPDFYVWRWDTGALTTEEREGQNT